MIVESLSCLLFCHSRRGLWHGEDGGEWCAYLSSSTAHCGVSSDERT